MTMERNRYFQAGYTLIEVLVGILIFALGMMALAQLQGNLSKSSADSNARTVAINIAEETVEALRTFSQVTADPDPDVDAFNDIVSGTQTVQRGGIDYTLTSTVTDYYFNPLPAASRPNPILISSLWMQRLELTVARGGPEFQADETTATAGLGTGTITSST
jgi:prepilin-type N-terminal cleavage/methylation domain-containing protein